VKRLPRGSGCVLDPVTSRRQRLGERPKAVSARRAGPSRPSTRQGDAIIQPSPACHHSQRGTLGTALARLAERLRFYIGNRSHRVIGLVRGARCRCFGCTTRLLFDEAAPFVAPRLVPADLVVTGAYHAATIRVGCLAAGARSSPTVFSIASGGAAARTPPPTAIFTSNHCAGSIGYSIFGLPHPSCGADGGAAHLYRRCGLRLAGTPRAQHMEEFWRVPRHSRCRSPLLPARRTRSVGERAARLPGHALSWRPRRDLLSGTRRGTGNGGSGCRQTLGLDTRAGHRWGNRVCGRRRRGFAAAAVRLLRDDGLWRRWHLAALARQRGMSWDAVGAGSRLWPIASRGELPSRGSSSLSFRNRNRTSLSSGLQEPLSALQGGEGGAREREVRWAVPRSRLVGPPHPALSPAGGGRG